MEKFKITILIYCLISNILLADLNGTLTLEKSIALAEENNFELKQIREQMLIDGLKETAHSHRYFPKLKPISISTGIIDTAHIQSGINMDLPTGAQMSFDYDQKIFDETPNFKLSLTQPLSHNTRLYDHQVKTLNLSINHLTKQSQYQKKLLSIIKRYRSCVSNQLSLNQQEHLIHDLKARFKKQEIEYKHGLISKTDMDKAMLAVATETADIIENKRKINSDLAELKTLLGIEDNKDVQLDLKQNFNIVSFDVNASQGLALDNELDYQVAKLNQKIARIKHLKHQELNKPKCSIYGQVDNTSESTVGLKFEFQPPSEEDDISDAEKYLSFTQSIEKHSRARKDLLHSVHEKVNSLKHQERLLTLSAKKLENAQSIYAAEHIKMKHNLISDDEFQVAIKNVKQTYRDSIQAQVLYQNLKDELEVMLGRFNPKHSHKDQS